MLITQPMKRSRTAVTLQKKGKINVKSIIKIIANYVYWTLAVACLVITGQALAQGASFPTRSLKIIVPTSPGSGSDTTARYVAEQLTTALGQPVIIDNKPGANGTIAAMAVKQAPADGYTIFLASNTHMAVNPIFVKDLPYDAI